MKPIFVCRHLQDKWNIQVTPGQLRHYEAYGLIDAPVREGLLRNYKNLRQIEIVAVLRYFNVNKNRIKKILDGDEIAKKEFLLQLSIVEEKLIPQAKELLNA